MVIKCTKCRYKFTVTNTGQLATCPRCGCQMEASTCEVIEPDHPSLEASTTQEMSNEQPVQQEERIRCPFCGEEILAIAKKCKHCGSWIDAQPQTPVPVMPPSSTYTPPVQARVGQLTISWPGVWMLMDAKVHLTVNDEHIGDYSFKDSFAVSVPINSSKMVVKITAGLCRFKKKLNLQTGTDYILVLSYSRTWGKIGSTLRMG